MNKTLSIFMTLGAALAHDAFIVADKEAAIVLAESGAEAENENFMRAIGQRAEAEALPEVTVDTKETQAETEALDQEEALAQEAEEKKDLKEEALAQAQEKEDLKEDAQEEALSQLEEQDKETDKQTEKAKDLETSDGEEDLDSKIPALAEDSADSEVFSEEHEELSHRQAHLEELAQSIGLNDDDLENDELI